MANPDGAVGTNALSKDDEWFRDRLVKQLTAAIPALMVLAGFLLAGNEERFSIEACCDPTAEKILCDKAKGLIGVSVVFYALWVASVVRLFRKLPVHRTVPTTWEVSGRLVAIGTVLAVMVGLAVY